jgi:hypothetical protein
MYTTNNFIVSKQERYQKTGGEMVMEENEDYIAEWMPGNENDDEWFCNENGDGALENDEDGGAIRDDDDFSFNASFKLQSTPGNNRRRNVMSDDTLDEIDKNLG